MHDSIYMLWLHEAVHLPCMWGIQISEWPTVGPNGCVRASTEVLITQDKPHRWRVIISYTQQYRTLWHLRLPDTGIGLYNIPHHPTLCFVDWHQLDYRFTVSWIDFHYQRTELVIVEKHTSFTPGIMVCGAMWSDFKSSLVVMQETWRHSATSMTT